MNFPINQLGNKTSDSKRISSKGQRQLLLKSSRIKVEMKEIPQWIDSLGVVAKKGDIAWNKNV